MKAKRKNRILTVFSLVVAMVLLISCGGRDSTSIPRKTAYPRIDRLYDTVYTCAYSPLQLYFNENANIERTSNDGFRVRYDKYSATLYCSYWEKLTQKDYVKVLSQRKERIVRDCGEKNPETYIVDNGKSLATVFYSLRDCLTPVHFLAEDSVNIVYGVIYLDKMENYDSISPIIDYLCYDVSYLIKHLRFEN